MRAMTKDERKRHDAANDAHRKAWEVDGGKVRDRLQKATAAFHARPLDAVAAQEFIDANEAVELNKRVVDDLHKERLRVFADIDRAIQLDHYAVGTSTCYEKVTFINGIKKMIPREEVDRLKRSGILKDEITK